MNKNSKIILLNIYIKLVNHFHNTNFKNFLLLYVLFNFITNIKIHIL